MRTYKLDREIEKAYAETEYKIEVINYKIMELQQKMYCGQISYAQFVQKSMKLEKVRDKLYRDIVEYNRKIYNNRREIGNIGIIQ